VTSLTLSPGAARRVAFIADRQGKPAVLRLSVDGGGCAGFSYKFELGEVEEGDAIAETDGVSLVVDEVSLGLLDGSEVDYVEDLGGAAFKVTNPNAASGCGCGSIFSV
jgi:iron-sulfur cluster assembly accessory protein